MEWDHYSFRVADTYASAIINGDYSGLSDEEEARLVAWLDSAVPAPHKGLGHWDSFGEKDSLGFCRDDVSGLYADCYALRYNFPVPEVQK